MLLFFMLVRSYIYFLKILKVEVGRIYCLHSQTRNSYWNIVWKETM